VVQTISMTARTHFDYYPAHRNVVISVTTWFMVPSHLECPGAQSQPVCIFETIRANILRVNKELRQLYGSEQNCKRVYFSSPKYAYASSDSGRAFGSTLQTCSFVYLQSVVVTECCISRWRPLRCFGLNVIDESTDGNFALFTQVSNLETYPRF